MPLTRARNDYDRGYYIFGMASFSFFLLYVLFARFRVRLVGVDSKIFLGRRHGWSPMQKQSSFSDYGQLFPYSKFLIGTTQQLNFLDQGPLFTFFEPPCSPASGKLSQTHFKAFCENKSSLCCIFFSSAQFHSSLLIYFYQKESTQIVNLLIP